MASDLRVGIVGLGWAAGAHIDAFKHVAGATVTYLSGAIPQPADTLLATYRVGGASSLGSQSLFPSAQVICSASGTATSAAVFASLGTCTLSQGLLQTGDRLEIRFDLAHQGATAGFEFKILWGATVVVDRSGAAIAFGQSFNLNHGC